MNSPTGEGGQTHGDRNEEQGRGEGGERLLTDKHQEHTGHTHGEEL